MLWWTVQNFALTTLLAAIVAIACRVGRLGPVARHGLWLVVLIKLVTPTVVSWPWAIHRSPATAAVQRMPAVSVPPQAVDEPLHYTIVRWVSPAKVEAAQPPRAVAAEAPVAASPVVTKPIDWPRVLVRGAVIVWIAGAAVLGLLQLTRIIRMIWRLRGASDADPELAGLVDDLSARLDLRKPVRCRIVPGLASPVVFSLLRPQLLWPAALPSSINAPARQGLIVHELAHIKRGDHLVGWLELIAGCLWWWNPLFWYVRHQLRENAELSCDAWVVQMLPRNGRRAYAEGLLSVCESIFDPSQKKPVTPLPAVGVNTGGRQFLERRLTMLFRDQVPLRLGITGWLSMLLMALGALPALSQKTGDSTDTSLITPTVGVDKGSEARSYRRGGGVSLRLGESPLPDDAQKVIEEYNQQLDRARAEYEQKIAKLHDQQVGSLKKLQDQYTKAGKLDEAVAIRDRIRQLTGETRVSFTQPVPTAPPTAVERVQSLQEYRDRVGQTVDVQITGTTEGFVWGSDVYTDDSNLGAAAVHAGVLQNGQTRVLRVRILQGQASYSGSTRNGVTSRDYAEWGGSFRFEQPLHGYRDTDAGAIGALENLRGQNGMNLVMELTGTTQGSVWGTDVYTDDSTLGAAAVHAGVLKDGEKGLVLITIEPGQSSYSGSTRNGVTSSDYHDWGGSFRIRRIEAQRSAGEGAAPGIELEKLKAGEEGLINRF